MLDRSIPFKNIILRCDSFCAGEPVLPPGYAFRRYRPGDEAAWARLEQEIGDFPDASSARGFFLESYGRRMTDLEERCFFITAAHGEIVASCMAWYEAQGDKKTFFLNWLVVSPAYQNRGLGKALFLRTMQEFGRRGERPVYIHTQPWSHKAILLYTNYGFTLMKRDTFCGYPNDCDEALAILDGLLERETLERLRRLAK